MFASRNGIIASFDKGGYDPFLCAQDVPGSFTVDEATVLGDTASVVLHEIWNPGTEYESVHDVTVVLHKMDGVWRIATVLCPGVGSSSEMPGAETMTPVQVVESFYQEGPVPTIKAL